jgi:hypothetical protein
MALIMTPPKTETNLIREKVNLETSQISWLELQRFFANGTAIAVSCELDLVEVAYQFSIDNKTLVAQWLQENKIGKVTDTQAQTWFTEQTIVWAVVVKPWLLVQP